jgi:hypothetical protein
VIRAPLYPGLQVWAAALFAAFLLLVPRLLAEPGGASGPLTASADAVIALHLPNPAQLIDRIIDPRIQGYLMTLPQYRSAIAGKTFHDLSGLVKVIAAQLDTTWEKSLKDLTGGGIVVLVEAPQGKEPHFLLIVTPTDDLLPDRALRAFLKLARQDAKDKGKPDPIKTSEHHGVALYSPADHPQAGLAILKGKLFASNSRKALCTFLDRSLDGRAQTAGQAAPGADKGKSAAGMPTESGVWERLSKRQTADTMAWGFARLDALRKLDPKRFASPEKPDAGQVLFFGSWLEAIKQASLVSATLDWSDKELSATLELPQPARGLPPKVKGYVPGAGEGAGPLLTPPRTIASLSLWRDWATIWESRTDLLPPEVVQNLAQLDTFAGQFFGGREFGTDVLGALDTHWRLIIAGQDFRSLKPAPDLKLPAFAIVAELNAPEGDFSQRLKIAYQTLVAITNVDAVQKKAVPLELGSEEVEGITLATSRYVLPHAATAASVTPQQRYNFSPSAAHVGKYFILSSSAGLARDLIKELKAPGKTHSGTTQAQQTVAVEADGPELARLLELNRERMEMQTMLGSGATREKAQEQVNALLTVLHYLVHGRLAIQDDSGATRLSVKIRLGDG